MGEHTAISWTDHTFNPWWGCTEVSPACDHCYARAWAKRTGFSDLWGPDSKRRFFSEAHWNEPLKWNRKAGDSGERRRVFCASMADVFDNHPAVSDARSRLWYLIRETPHLDWLLLTKRIGNAAKMLPLDWHGGYPNVWIGATVVSQAEADRDIPKLLDTPARIRFLSCEPLLGPIVIRHYTLTERPCFVCSIEDELKQIRGTQSHPINCGWRIDQERSGPIAGEWLPCGRGIDWVITGGESGGDARPVHPDWIRGLRDQCVRAGTPFHHKQWGEWSPTGGGRTGNYMDVGEGLARHLMVRLGKKASGRMLDGRTWDEFPRSAA